MNELGILCCLLQACVSHPCERMLSISMSQDGTVAMIFGIKDRCMVCEPPLMGLAHHLLTYMVQSTKLHGITMDRNLTIFIKK